MAASIPTRRWRPPETEAFYAELGATDPHLNLRREQALILRVDGARRHAFVSVLEAHGEYNGAEEFTIDSEPTVTGLQRYSQGRRGRHPAADEQRRRDGTWDFPTIRTWRPNMRSWRAIANLRWRGYYGLFDHNGTPIQTAQPASKQ